MSWVEYAAFLTTVVWYVSVVRLGVFWQLHHFHVGMLLFILGGESWVAWLGVLLAAEDAMQHSVQNWRSRYQSPVHRLYVRFLWPHLPSWLQRL